MVSGEERRSVYYIHHVPFTWEMPSRVSTASWTGTRTLHRGSRICAAFGGGAGSGCPMAAGSRDEKKSGPGRASSSCSGFPSVRRVRRRSTRLSVYGHYDLQPVGKWRNGRRGRSPPQLLTTRFTRAAGPAKATRRAPLRGRDYRKLSARCPYVCLIVEGETGGESHLYRLPPSMLKEPPPTVASGPTAIGTRKSGLVINLGFKGIAFIEMRVTARYRLH